jgi:predicted transcriptional regulator
MFFSLLKKIKVRDAMKAGVITVDVEASVSQVISELTKNDVSGLVVIDEFGETWGVISSIDIISALSDKSIEDIDKLTAEDLMTPHAIEVDPEKTLEDAARLMADKGIHRLVIGHPHEGRRVPVGIITASDIVNQIQKDISK